MKTGTILAVVLLGFLAVSCRQDSIFYIISTETAPRPPRIEGAPTNMVVFQREYPDREEPVPVMYVASGRLHWYAKAPGADELDKPQWDLDEYAVPQPGGKIIALAVAGNRLYVLSMDGYDVSMTLRYIESGGDEWVSISSGAIQTIYADPDMPRLFVGAGRGPYDIRYLDNNDTFQTLKSGTSLLSGAVCRKEGNEDIYYLSTSTTGLTEGDGIFRISENDLQANNTGSVQQLNDGTKRIFMSMIKLKDNTIIAVERTRGTLYKVEEDGYEPMRYTITDNTNQIETDRYAMCGLTLWEEIDPVSGDTIRRLLIASIQGVLYSTTTSSYTYGYVEFELNDKNGSFNTGAPRRDPGSLLSVSDNDRYTTSLGKHPINHLFQAPREIDPDMTFFASTQTAGLFSYRNRPDNGGWQWNAEE